MWIKIKTEFKPIRGWIKIKTLTCSRFRTGLIQSANQRFFWPSLGEIPTHKPVNSPRFWPFACHWSWSNPYIHYFNISFLFFHSHFHNYFLFFIYFNSNIIILILFILYNSHSYISFYIKYKYFIISSFNILYILINQYNPSFSLIIIISF